LRSSKYTGEARRRITEGGSHDLDNLCSTLDPVALGISDELHDGRIHPYFARRSSHYAGSGPLSEAMTAEDYLQVLICSSYIC
jgi:hypothetical protein